VRGVVSHDEKELEESKIKEGEYNMLSDEPGNRSGKKKRNKHCLTKEKGDLRVFVGMDGVRCADSRNKST